MINAFLNLCSATGDLAGMVSDTAKAGRNYTKAAPEMSEIHSTIMITSLKKDLLKQLEGSGLTLEDVLPKEDEDDK